MPSRRDAIKMTDDEVWAFLDGRHTLQTASINKDGTPHLVVLADPAKPPADNAA